MLVPSLGSGVKPCWNWRSGRDYYETRGGAAKVRMRLGALPTHRAESPVCSGRTSRGGRRSPSASGWKLRARRSAFFLASAAVGVGDIATPAARIFWPAGTTASAAPLLVAERLGGPMWMRSQICTQIISALVRPSRIIPGRWYGEISTPQCALSICVQFGLFVQDAPETRPMGTGEGGRICHPGAGGVSCAPQPCPAPGGLTFREPSEPGTPPWVDIRQCTIPTLRPPEPPPQSARPHSDACPGGAWLALSRAQRPCVPHCAFTPRRRRSCRRRSRRTGPWSGRCRPRRWGTAR